VIIEAEKKRERYDWGVIGEILRKYKSAIIEIGVDMGLAVSSLCGSSPDFSFRENAS